MGIFTKKKGGTKVGNFLRKITGGVKTAAKAVKGAVNRTVLKTQAGQGLGASVINAVRNIQGKPAIQMTKTKTPTNFGVPKKNAPVVPAGIYTKKGLAKLSKGGGGSKSSPNIPNSQSQELALRPGQFGGETKGSNPRYVAPSRSTAPALKTPVAPANVDDPLNLDGGGSSFSSASSTSGAGGGTRLSSMGSTPLNPRAEIDKYNLEANSESEDLALRLAEENASDSVDTSASSKMLK